MTSPRTLAGRYELHRAIGRGGMGQVWAATDERLRRQVAVKTVDLGAGADPVVGERFRQEAQATAALSSPNIVTIYDSGLDGDTAYIVMELLTGPSLEELVRRDGPLPVDRALGYGAQVASALAAAHDAGIVHRDIKPSNLMLDGRGGLKVVDFGIARLDQERADKLTATATVVGSAPYLSPEQATGGTATPQSDLYSLGCVLVTLLTGEPPFAGEHPLSVLHQHLSAPPPLPSTRRPEVGPAVDQLVAQLLAKSPADRPAAARDVAERLQAIRRGHLGGAGLAPAGDAPTATMPPVTAPVRTAPQRAVPPRPAEPPRRAAPVAEPVSRGGGGLAGWLVAAVLVLSLLAGGAYLLLGRRASTPAPAPVTTVTLTPSATPTSTTAEPTTSSAEPTSSSPTSVPTTTRRTRTVTPSSTSASPTSTETSSTATPTPTSEPTTSATTDAPSTETPTADPTTPAKDTATIPEMPSASAS